VYTVSARACAPAQAEPSFSAAVKRAGSASPRNHTSLRGKRSFDRVYRKGSRVRQPAMTIIAVKASPSSDRESARTLPQVAFVASRAVGNAVDRNRAKRRLREAALRADLPVGWDLVIAAREGTATMPFGELVTQLRKGLARLRVNAGVGEKPN